MCTYTYIYIFFSTDTLFWFLFHSFSVLLPVSMLWGKMNICTNKNDTSKDSLKQLLQVIFHKTAHNFLLIPHGCGQHHCLHDWALQDLLYVVYMSSISIWLCMFKKDLGNFLEWLRRLSLIAIVLQCLGHPLLS